MRIEFVRPQSRGPVPANILAEAEIHFDAMTYSGGRASPSPFSGLKLVGFTVRKGDRGDPYVTLPSRAFGVEKDRFFEYLRAGDAPPSVAAKSHLYRFKRWITEEYKEWDAGDSSEPRDEE